MPMPPPYDSIEFNTKTKNNLDIKHCKCSITESKSADISNYLENTKLKELMITIDGQTMFIWTAEFNAKDLQSALNNKILSGVKK